MDFYLSIPAITKAIKVYLNTYQTLEEREKTRNTTVTELKELGWSGLACDAFMEAHEQKMQLYAKLKEDILYMINALQEEKQRALMLKARCEDFVNCIRREGQGGPITGDDEGILSLDFSSQARINNYVNNCVDDDYVTLNSNFSKIQDILGSLEYTSFGIEGDVDTLINSVKDQTESLTEFDDSFNVYYAGVKDMESNICSVFSKISASGYSPFQNSSVLLPNGEIDKNFLVNAALRTENGFTIDTLGADTNITNGMKVETLSLKNEEGLTSEDEDKLAYIEKTQGTDAYNKYKELMLKNPEDVTHDERKMLNQLNYDYSMEKFNLANGNSSDDASEETATIDSVDKDDEEDDELVDADEYASGIRIQTTDGAAVTFDGDIDDIEDYNDSSNWADDLKQMATDLMWGFGYRITDNLTWGGATKAIGANDDTIPQTKSATVGKILGDAASYVVSGIEGGASGVAELAGITLDSSGVGVVPGVALNGAGAVLATHAIGSIAKTSDNIGSDAINLMSGDGSSSKEPPITSVNKDGDMLGKNGAQIYSDTKWQNGKTERVDVENPNPGKRAGDVHYHDAKNNKYRFSVSTGELYDENGDLAANKIQKVLKDKDVQKAIDKGLQALGEKPYFK